MALKAAVVPVTPFQQNCAVLWEGETGRGVVVDPGGDVERILGALAELKVVVERILLTHGHVDHAAGAAELRDALAGTQGAPPPIEGPDEHDRFLLDDLERQAATWDLPARNVSPDRWLAEGDSVDVAGQAFAVLHCPGHTPGHVAFVSEALRVAVVGDVLFRGSVGRTDFPYGDQAALLGAIRGRLLPLGDDIGFLCGHGPGSTFGHERRHNPFLRQE